MKVRNKATGEYFYIADADAAKIGQPVTIPVYDHEPHGKGSFAKLANGIQMFVDYRHEAAGEV